MLEPLKSQFLRYKGTWRASLGGKRNSSPKSGSSLKTLQANKGASTNGVSVSRRGRATDTAKGPASQGEVLTGAGVLRLRHL